VVCTISLCARRCSEAARRVWLSAGSKADSLFRCPDRFGTHPISLARCKLYSEPPWLCPTFFRFDSINILLKIARMTVSPPIAARPVRLRTLQHPNVARRDLRFAARNASMIKSNSCKLARHDDGDHRAPHAGVPRQARCGGSHARSHCVATGGWVRCQRAWSSMASAATRPCLCAHAKFTAAGVVQWRPEREAARRQMPRQPSGPLIQLNAIQKSARFAWYEDCANPGERVGLRIDEASERLQERGRSLVPVEFMQFHRPIVAS
jgi:hypothetical protein